MLRDLWFVLYERGKREKLLREKLRRTEEELNVSCLVYQRSRSRRVIKFIKEKMGDVVMHKIFNSRYHACIDNQI